MYFKFRIIIIIISAYCFRILQGKVVLKLDRFEMVNVTADSPLTWGEFRFNFTPQYGTIMNSEGYIHQDVPGDNCKVDVVLTKCSSKEALDTCEPFKYMKVRKFCYFLNMKNMPWTNFVDTFHPSIRCPFKKGKIVQRDSIFDIDVFKVFPLVGPYWKFNVKFFVDNKYACTALVEGSAVYANAKNN